METEFCFMWLFHKSLIFKISSRKCFGGFCVLGPLLLFYFWTTMILYTIFLNLRNKNTKFKRNTIVSIILFSLPGVTQMKNTCKLRNSVFSREVKQTLYTESSFESPQRTRRVWFFSVKDCFSLLVHEQLKIKSNIKKGT